MDDNICWLLLLVAHHELGFFANEWNQHESNWLLFSAILKACDWNQFGICMPEVFIRNFAAMFFME